MTTKAKDAFKLQTQDDLKHLKKCLIQLQTQRIVVEDLWEDALQKNSPLSEPSMRELLNLYNLIAKIILTINHDA